MLTNYRAFTSAYAHYFSEESDVKRRRLEVEERRLLLEEKAQVMDMVKVGIYTPRSARQRIKEIDERVKPPTTNYGEPRVQSQGRFQTLSPSPDRCSPPWDIEDPDRSLGGTEDES